MKRQFDTVKVRANALALSTILPDIEWIDGARVERLSQDFYWFSPVLKSQLANRFADIVARPKTEGEVVAIVRACALGGIPITVRGSGTGNYGQCIPLHGGVILDLSAYNKLLWVKAGVARAQAGIRMGDMDKLTQAEGWELRCIPSTFRSATLGGLYGGGFGGVGSINYGPLVSAGNVLSVRAITLEAEPQLLEIKAPEALTLHHVYGTNGIVLEMEVALAPAHAWLENIVSFENFDDALHFSDRVANAPGIVKKSVTLFAAPIGGMLSQAVPQLVGSLPVAAHTVFTLVADFAEPALTQMVTEHRGTVSLRRTLEEVKKTNRTIVECTWNHTTLQALKIDKSLTYIQTGFQPGRHVEQVKKMRDTLGDEVPMHVEFIRNKEGLMTCSGLQLVRYSTEARLNEIMQIYRDHGAYIANPHVYIVEDGKQGGVNAAVVAAKSRFDPSGLLNPGKLRGWDER
jgi:FAD/FMN-containing dehydrogenase